MNARLSINIRYTVPLGLLLICLVLPAQGQDQTGSDSTTTTLLPNVDKEVEVDSTSLKSLPKDHTPRRVLTRALLVPGWGQIYNRQYLRAAIYYAGLGAGGTLVYSSNKNYLLFRHAALYAEYRDTPEEERPGQYRDNFVEDYEQALRAIEDFRPESELSEEEQIERRALRASTFRSQRDIFRRRRDLNILLTFGIWGLGVIESFVSAHLLHFDVSEDLTLQVIPTLGGTATTLTFRF